MKESWGWINFATVDYKIKKKKRKYKYEKKNLYGILKNDNMALTAKNIAKPSA